MPSIDAREERSLASAPSREDFRPVISVFILDNLHQHTEMEAMSRPLVVLCAYLVREIAERWQAVKLPAREVRGSSIPRLGHAELDAAQKRRRRRRMKKWRRTLTCEQRGV